MSKSGSTAIKGNSGRKKKRAARFRELSSSLLLRGSVNIQIRVKQSYERNLMHDKAWCLDHRLLRDGSANWSPGAEKGQDNEIRFTTDPRQIAAFEEMWSRSSNRVIQ